MHRGVVALLALLSLSAGCSDPEGPRIACVAEGTRIASPAGEVRVESLRVGDHVWSVDPASGERVDAQVIAVRSARKPCLELRASDGRVLRATAEHPIYDAESRAYVPLGEWQVDVSRRALLSLGDRQVEAASVSVKSSTRVRRVYDLTVDSRFHNFVAERFLVHNKTGNQPGRVHDLRVVEVGDTFAIVSCTIPSGAQGPPDRFVFRFQAEPDSLPSDPERVLVSVEHPFRGDTLTERGQPLLHLRTYSVRVGVDYSFDPGFDVWSDKAWFETTR